MNKLEMTEAIVLAKAEKQLTWEQLGNDLSCSPVWLAYTCLGMNSAPEDKALAIAEYLGLGAEVAEALKTYRENYFYPLKLDQQSLKVESGVSIISLALSYHNGQPLYLFASSSTKDEKFAPAPVKMISLSADGKRAERPDEAPFAKVLQFASLDWEANGAPTGKGLKADITYLSAETLPDINGTLVGHMHHNHIGVFHDSYLVSANVEEWIRNLGGAEKLSQANFGPEKYNELFEKSSQDQLTPPILPLHSQITRIVNFVYTEAANMRPNYYSIYSRIVSPMIVKEKPSPKTLWYDPCQWLFAIGMVSSHTLSQKISFLTYPEEISALLLQIEEQHCRRIRI
ncbi:hypothetical protein [Endozoicomonas numazuensis]|uniref:hypothetical protein n=1 Tax=Endozoicomonas numazuensis TaxID=1137799 RepID=UPI00068F60F4|nr:hypothetical protein [Endozoicomonas numazuensis]